MTRYGIYPLGDKSDCSGLDCSAYTLANNKIYDGAITEREITIADCSSNQTLVNGTCANLSCDLYKKADNHQCVSMSQKEINEVKTELLKASVSDFQNAVDKAAEKYGSIYGWDYPSSVTSENPPTDEDYYNFWKKYFNDFLPAEKFENGKIYLKNGAIISFVSSGLMDTYIDIDGNKGENAIGKDQFVFGIPKTASDSTIGRIDGNFGSYSWGEDLNTREKALNKCKQDQHYCSKLLEYDNWEFKDDYPY